MLAPEGRIILFTLLITTLTAGMIGFYYDSEHLLVCSAIFGLLFLFSCNFFRDPVRSIPVDESSMVAPADGKIIRIDQVNDGEIGESANRISIFLSVFNVHVNRVPMTCTVKDVKYIPGKFLAAYDHKASDENEKTEILFSGENITYRVHQIAGIIARRIRCYAEKDLKMVKGDRLGFIMFGSRTDIIFPKSVQIEVDLGDKVKGGETIIGKMI